MCSLSKFVFPALCLALAAASVQAAGPSIRFEMDGEAMIITYTGTLYQSADGIHWEKAPYATSPYLAMTNDRQMFFCSGGQVPEPKPGEDFVALLPGGVELSLAWIAPGSFIMGSPVDEVGRDMIYDETQHPVTLTKGFWMGQYEVTQAQYESVMETDPSQFRGADHPVDSISWNDAKAFCEKLNEAVQTEGLLPEGYKYALPTEAQWEYACRAGTTTALNNGKDLSDEWDGPEIEEVGWYLFNSGAMSQAVGQKQPNAWGLYDMHGNVFEWCTDWFASYPAGEQTDPTGAETGENKVMRGGSWDSVAGYCRSAFRRPGAPDVPDNRAGLRLILVKDGTGQEITIPLAEGVDLEIVMIEPGTFIMGSPEDELGRDSDETQHEVTLTQEYWLGKYEVTQAQYEAIMGTNPSKFKGADLPVERVTWFDAKEFCEKLTAIEKAAGRLPEGYEFTLPTEAQWEYACRAGTTTALNNGKNLSDKEQCPEMDEVGWYWYNSGIDGKRKTHPVGQKQSNAWGLYDMHGNVNEWCLDWFGDYPTTAVTDPTGPITGEIRVMRGGNWGYSASSWCRSAFRNHSYSDSLSFDLGFRVALAPVPANKEITIPLAEGVDLEIVMIRPGTFLMGSPEDELGRRGDEIQHEVTLTREYGIGKYEVTQAQYEAVMGKNPSHFKGADLPVERVSWNDAMAFCAKLTAAAKASGELPEGYEFTLPTEAQWEYACRAGTTTALNNGKNLSDEWECPEMDEVGWYDGNSGYKTHPVGQKLPNAWGLYDMHGNVHEWCLDWYGDYPTGAVTDPTGPDTGSLRVDRDGSWVRVAMHCRSAVRTCDTLDSVYGDVGFRVALAPVPANKEMTIQLAEGVDLDIVWIRPGTFIMGSPEDELGRWDDEVQHEVTLTQEYGMGKYEITQAQYEAIMGTNPSQKWKGADLPVECVTWFDAMVFCARLTAAVKASGELPEGYEFTLPTEAQWEYACRAGTTTAFNNGTNIPTEEQTLAEPCSNLDEVGWYFHNNDQLHPVGQKLPNAWGLYDMHGNVYEWCLDWYGDYPTSAVTDPTGPDVGERRAERGGNLYSLAYACRSACRTQCDPSGSSNYRGFRVALAPTKNMTIPLAEGVDLEINWIRPGSFIMGSPEDELGRYDNETQHEVTLTQEYWLGKYEVTQAQYEAVMRTNPSNWKGADLPVEMVSWDEAKEFCARLTEIEREAGRLPKGYVYALPTEAQWEYACRAGTTTAFNNGTDIPTEEQRWDEPCPNLDKVGWYWYNGGEENFDQGLICTHPGGEKQPNAWGLYDMHGNVEEWCSDWYEDYPASAVTDPTGADTGKNRVKRGGGWLGFAYGCRSAFRDNNAPSYRHSALGFRVALVPVNKNMTIPLAEGVNLDMIWIRPGTFIMGSPEDELGRDSDEAQHEVTLTQEYWLGKYQITQAQYEAIMGTNPSNWKGADLPVECVSWFDAMEFCEKLTSIEKAAGRLPEGYEFTLPTDAQWEYACRAGTTTALNSGKNLSDEKQCPEIDEVGWYRYNSDGKTHPAGQKQPNAWGLYDMHGNVNEWCLDWYGDYPASAVTDPTGPVTGEKRALRGGDWGYSALFCRSAYRNCCNPGASFDNNGFRVALAPTKNMTIPLAEGVDLEMVWIRPGTFIMGSPEDELGREDKETQHEVTLTQEYWLGKYEITQAQYETVMGTNPSNWKGADLPEVQVSWNDAMAFCAKLTAAEKAAGRLPEGYEYTLPTEAQWEYACRAGTTTALNSGKNLSDKEQCPEMDEVGWYDYNSGYESHPVGQKLPNAWGLYDMHGNVNEWCLDWYGAYPTSAVTDPTGPDTGSYRVIRSSGWYYNADFCRSAYRGSNAPGSSYIDCGFRVALAPTKVKTIPLAEGVNLDMIWIWPGTFIMGSPEDELGRDSDETQHEVTLTQEYWLGKYEVTQAQYEAIMGTNPSKFKGADLPVEQVSWDDAMEFCKKLTAKEKAAGRLPEGYEYTLPTEAQWEYACRAGTTTALNNGKNLSDKEQCPEMDEVGWYWYNSGIDGKRKTHPVGQKQSNAWGLYDMHGNVNEWCLDWFGDYPTTAVTDPTGPITGETRMMRGGNWGYSASWCRSAFRNHSYSDSLSFDLGFRVALAPVQ